MVLDAEGTVASELVGRIQQGDEAAERALVERYSPGLRLLLRRLARNPDLAADLEQETFRLVLEKVRGGEIRSPEKLAAFARAAARNLFIMDRRKASRYVELDDATVAQPARAGSGDALDQAIRQQEASMVRRLLGELRNDRDRQLLVRYYLSEEPRETICLDLEIDPGRLNRVLFRARKRLRELVDRAHKRLGFPGRPTAASAPGESRTSVRKPDPWAATSPDVGASRRG